MLHMWGVGHWRGVVVILALGGGLAYNCRICFFCCMEQWTQRGRTPPFIMMVRFDESIKALLVILNVLSRLGVLVVRVLLNVLVVLSVVWNVGAIN